MPLHLEGTAGNVAGKRLTVARDKPFVIRAKTTNHEAGRVIVEFRDGSWRVDNQSRMACRLNAQEQRQAVLAHGDVLEIGKDGFRIAIASDQDEGSAQDARPAERPEAVVEDDQPQCAVCDAPIAASARPRSWNDGERWICQRCVAKGVKPDHLPRPGGAPAAEAPPATARSLAALPLDPGEPTPLTTQALPPALDDTDEMLPGARDQEASSTETRPQGDSDRLRHSRRISASRLAAVEPAARGQGLLSKMGKVFRRDDRQVRLEELERARSELLSEAGRHALGPDGGMGLPEHAVSALLKGGTVTLSGADLSASGLDRWRTQRQRMALLDAEIGAIRRALGLGPDPEVHAQSSPTLRADQRVHQERAFATLDGMATDDLSGHARPASDESDIVEEPAAPGRAQSSTRLRATRRRR
jgi:hypothetical protein